MDYLSLTPGKSKEKSETSHSDYVEGQYRIIEEKPSNKKTDKEKEDEAAAKRGREAFFKQQEQYRIEKEKKARKELRNQELAEKKRLKEEEKAKAKRLQDKERRKKKLGEKRHKSRMNIIKGLSGTVEFKLPKKKKQSKTLTRKRKIGLL